MTCFRLEINFSLQHIVLDEDEKDKTVQFELTRLENKAAAVMKGDKLTREMVDSFIDVVYLYDKDHMEIKFTFEDLIPKKMEQLEKE